MSDISKTKVSLRIFGQDLIPEEITALLGCLPTQSAKVGDVDPRQMPSSRIVKEGFWRLEFDKENILPLEKKVDLLLNELTNDLKSWETITLKFKAEIFCGLFLNNFNEGFMLSPKLTKKLSDRNLEIGFDIYLP